MSSDVKTNRKWINDFLANPAVWLITTIIVVIVAYILIPGPETTPPEDVVRKIVSSEFKSNVQSIETEPAQPPVKEDNMLITREDDKQRFDSFLEVEEIDKKIQPLFISAREHVDNDRLVGTDGNNAWQNYQAILDIDPENTEARSGMSTILDFLIENAEMAMEARRYDEAESWIELLDIAQPGDLIQDEFRQEIAAQIAKVAEAKKRKLEKEERERQISALVDEAREESKPFTFDFDKVRDIYLEILEIEPNSIQGKNGLISLSNRELDNAEILIRASMLNRAQELIQSAERNYPDNSRLSGLRLALEVQEKKYEQEKRIAQEKLEQEAAQKKAQSEARAQAERETEEAAARAQAQRDREAQAQKQLESASSTQASGGSESQNIPPSPNQSSEASSTVEQNSSQDSQRLMDGITAYYAGNYARAFEVLFPIAQNGEPRAQFRLGMMYLEGRSVSKDPNAAAGWFTKALPGILGAAENGSSWAQTDLGTAYELGISLKQDYERAAYWYHLAAESGYAGAQTNLGVMYANGDGLPVDNKKAIFWLSKAAEQGDTIAAQNLKVLLPRVRQASTKAKDDRSATEFRVDEVDK